MNKTGKSRQVKVTEVMPMSPHATAVYEAGKAMMAASMEAGREFCKSMIGTSTAAIPVYFGILTFILPEHYKLGHAGGLTIAIPAFGFLLTAIIFSFGYMPIHKHISLEDISAFEEEREKMINSRRWFIWLGAGTFSISVICAIYTITINLGVR